MKNYLNLLCLIILTFITQTTIAQSQECDGHIREASENFRIGDFNEVIEKLTPCVERENAFSKNKYLEDAYVLLASTFIAKDSMTKAREYVDLLIDLNPNFETRVEDLLLFRRMIEDARRGDIVAQVSSVSKMNEKLHEAPASVILITAEEISRRGYLDLEALLHDLPGFDISRSNGFSYSNIYQRGYRSDNTDRMLLLVDGVEENDLWSNRVYLSRQYPLSNIKSIEVIYGPTSTLYGANAYAGIISITTKKPVEVVDKNQKVGISAEGGYGSWNTRYADATMAVVFPNTPVSLSVTGRIFQSDEPNFSSESFNDFKEHSLSDPFTPLGNNATFQDLFEHRLNITDNASANAFYQLNQNHANANYFQLNIDGNGDSSITLTNTGLTKVNELENTLWSNTNYSDKTNAYAFAAKMQFGNLQLGWQYWAKEEGAGVAFTDLQQGGTNEGQFWSPYSNFFYAKFNTRLSNALNFTSFTRYKVHGFLTSNRLVDLNGYSNGEKDLTNLLNDEAISFGEPIALTTRSNQMRSENRLVYTPNANFSLLTGLELRYSAVQDNYSTVSTNGISSGQDHFFFGDIGIYTQARYKVNDVTFTGGIRYDNNKLLDTLGLGVNTTGYGSQLSPRLAIVYHPDGYVFKAIVATGFKNATNFERYSTINGQRDLSSPSLQPERVLNYEVSGRRFFDTEKRSSIELVGYFANYNNLISTKTVDFGSGSTTQFENNGIREVYGIQAWIDYRLNKSYGDFYFYGNYTFTQPTDKALANNVLTNSNGDTLVQNGFPMTEARVGDIAKHQVNVGINYLFKKQLNINLRGNFVGERQTGLGTTVNGNEFQFDPYFVLNGALTYHFPKSGIAIQGIVNNILNKKYYSPGLVSADNWQYSSALPQNPINFHLKIKWDFSFSKVDSGAYLF